MQDSLPAGWLAFAGRELNPLDRYERFPSCYISSPFPEFILTLDGYEFEGRKYKSLSVIARDITGTRWNGYRFFGLREAPRHNQ
jgi:hypothetical protein